MNDNFFKNKVVLITGSSSGIGRTTARLLLSAGAKVALNARNEERLETTRQELSELGEVIAVPGDMSNWEDVQQTIIKTEEAFGGIDAIICNAGIKYEDTFRQTSPETLQKVMQVNFMGKILPIKAGFDALTKSQGSVILVSSLAGLYGLPGASIYSSSKMALAAIRQSLASELSKHNVHIGIIYVGFTENDESSSILDGSGVARKIPKRNIAKQSQETVARAMLRMIVKRKGTKVMTALGGILAFLARFAPGMVRLILKRRLKEMEDSL